MNTTMLGSETIGPPVRCCVCARSRCDIRVIFLSVAAVVLVYNFVLLTSLKPSTSSTVNNNIREPGLPQPFLPLPAEQVITGGGGRGQYIATTTTTINSTGMTEEQYFRRRPTKVAPYRYRIVDMPATFCRTTPGSSQWYSFFSGGSDDRDSVYAVVLVHSHPSNVEKRAAIRGTWGVGVRTGVWADGRRVTAAVADGATKMYLVFVVGRSTTLADDEQSSWESEQYEDIVRGDFVDAYENLTLKSLLGLKLMAEQCPSARYVIKTDDDVIVNLPHLVDVLERRRLAGGMRRAIMGPHNGNSWVYGEGKWKVDVALFPFKRFPPYESGAAYVITNDLSRELFETAEYVPHINIDDVYVTGVLGRVLGVRHEMQNGFPYALSKAPSGRPLTSGL